MDDVTDTIVINVGGLRHKVLRETLQRLPSTRLARLTESDVHYHSKEDEYYFDRHPAVFAAILNVYRTGELHMPLDVCGPAFKLELDFWGLDEAAIQECCWIRYNVDRGTRDTLEILDQAERAELEQFTVINKSAGCCTRSSWERIRVQMWQLLECPLSSRPAKVYAFVSFVMVVLSIFVLCAETHPAFQVEMTHEDFAQYYGISLHELYMDWYGTIPNTTNVGSLHPEHISEHHPRLNSSMFSDADEDDLMVPYPAFVVVDLLLIIFFSLELVVRFTFSPDKLRFFSDGLNVVAIISVQPFYIERIVHAVYIKERYAHDSVVDALFILKVFRIFRILRLLSHYRGLQVLSLTVRHSWKEMLLLAVFLFISIIIFGSLIYFTNRNENFSNIPRCFWWAIVTMTTVGYGDVYPTTDLGYLVGAFCALTGVLVIGFTVPMLVNNFLLFYSHVAYRKTTMKLHKATTGSTSPRRVICLENDDQVLGMNQST